MASNPNTATRPQEIVMIYGPAPPQHGIHHHAHIGPRHSERTTALVDGGHVANDKGTAGGVTNVAMDGGH